MPCLRMGAKLIGDKYYSSEQKPFEKFYTVLYNHTVEAFLPEARRLFRTDRPGTANIFP